MNEKFLGVGLTNALGIALFTMIFFVMMKVIFIKYPVNGISTLVTAA